MQKITVVTINRNNDTRLEETIKSVVKQTYCNIEYVVVDGASTDGSVDVIKQYQSQITQWVSEPDKGIYNAMNKGIKMASGEYVIFLNSGDCFIGVDTIEKIFSEEQNCDFVLGNVLLIGRKMRIRNDLPKKITSYHLFFGTICHQATFTKRVLFDELGKYDEQLQIVSDWKFIVLALARYNKTVQLLKQDIALVDATGISGAEESTEIIKKERKDILMKYFPLFYEDYIEFHRFKRLNFRSIKRRVIWRLRHLLYK